MKKIQPISYVFLVLTLLSLIVSLFLISSNQVELLLGLLPATIASLVFFLSNTHLKRPNNSKSKYKLLHGRGLHYWTHFNTQDLILWTKLFTIYYCIGLIIVILQTGSISDWENNGSLFIFALFWPLLLVGIFT